MQKIKNFHNHKAMRNDDDTVLETKGKTILWASLYDYIINLMLLGREKAIRKEMVELAQVKAGETVLDVGCGTGSLTIAAKAQAGPTGQLHGTDAAPEMIEAARRKAARAGIDVDFQAGLIEDISFPDDYFDVVLSSMMMHHLPDDLKRRGFIELHRVLKPGGRLLVVDFKRPTTLTSRILITLLLHGTMQNGVEDLPAMMENAGFTNIEVGRITFRAIGFVRGQAGSGLMKESQNV